MPGHSNAWSDSTAPFTLRLGLFLLFCAVVLNGLIYAAAPAQLKENALNHSWDVVNGRGSDDSWGAMQAGLDYFATPNTTPLYSEIFFNRQYRFQYPPSALFTLQGLQWLAPDNVRTNEVQTFPGVTLNDLVGWVFILATGLAAAALLELQIRKRYAIQSRVLVAARVAIAAGFTLTFYPIVKAYTLGQLQVWINGLFAVALLCWALGWKSLSGFLVGLTCLMKPHYGLFLAWALLRAEWRFMAVCAATVIAGLGAAVLVFGFANHIDYLRVVSFLGQHGEAYYPNHSINGLLNRIMSIADPEQYKNLEFVAGHFPPFNPWVYGLTVSSSAAILAAALLHRSTTGDPARLYDFCLMALSCTMASPIAWEHHYGVLLPIFAVLVTAVAPKPLALGLLAAAYALASVYIPATMLLAPTPFNFAQSYLLFAALIVLALLHWRPWADAETA
ncbi:MAG: glycosyltransferase family 87 protein [Hyphomicrobiaceae bacterium]